MMSCQNTGRLVDLAGGAPLPPARPSHAPSHPLTTPNLAPHAPLPPSAQGAHSPSPLHKVTVRSPAVATSRGQTDGLAHGLTQEEDA